MLLLPPVPMDLTAGGEAEITVVYTAAGDISGGMLKLTIPDNWSHPLMENVKITTTGSIAPDSAMDFGGYYVGAPDDTEDDMDVPEGGPDAMEVLVDSVRLDADETVTFVYSGTVQPTMDDDATFGVDLDGGAGPGTGLVDVAAPEDSTLTLTVSVGEAAAGSGTAGVDLMGETIIAGSIANELTFTYTAVGTIGYPREFRVSIPAGWSEPNSGVDNDEGTYTVALTDEDGRTRANVVEALDSVERDLVARVRAGSSTVDAGDVVSFTYENADAPRAPERSTFKVLFDNQQVGDDLIVVVQSEAGATALDVNAPASVSADDGESVAVTLMLQDDSGNAAAMGTDQDVALSSSSANGSFIVDGEAVTMVTIPAGESSAMVYYSDTTVGVATITATAGDLTDTATIVVSTDVVEITSVTVTSPLAMVGDTVTVSARGTAGKAVMYSVLNANDMGVQPSTMTEDEAGSYSGMFDVVVDHHPDGDYTVTVNLNGESMTASLTIDSTAPAVTVSDIEGMVANGDTVMISAMVEEADGSDVDFCYGRCLNARFNPRYGHAVDGN